MFQKKTTPCPSTSQSTDCNKEEGNDIRKSWPSMSPISVDRQKVIGKRDFNTTEWFEKCLVTSACLTIVWTAIVEFETSVITIARCVTQIFDDGVLRCLLNDARSVSARATQTGLFATAQAVDRPTEYNNGQNEERGDDRRRYHPRTIGLDCWIHVHTDSVVARLEWLTGPHVEPYP